ncbi:RNA polymerase sigma factor [Methylocaldum gracile subsp. desertum]|uniref:RNA polymerase sigma factor n=1 Tax=Methylocaldum sp. GT1BW TaxID=3438964 RepID=UPI003DA1176C
MSSLTHDQIFRLFRDYREPIVAFLMRRVQCPETALDLSQETYLRLVRKETLAHAENLPAYLFRTAERLAIDYLRQNRQTFVSADSLADDLTCPKLSPDELASLRQQCEILLDAIASLPGKCRHVFLLRKIDDLSYGEIAARLGISEKTVQRQLVKAMLHCHRRMQDPQFGLNGNFR